MSESGVLTLETRESLTEKLGYAHAGYTEVVESINVGRNENKIEPATPQQLILEFEEWIDQSRLDYINAQMEADSELSYVLVTTANETVTPDEVTEVLTSFGYAQPNNTEIWSLVLNKYSPQEVSRTDPLNGKKLLFKLIPSRLHPNMYGTVKQQKAKLAQLKINHPFLDSTSPLENATYLRTKRAVDGGTLGDQGTT